MIKIISHKVISHCDVAKEKLSSFFLLFKLPSSFTQPMKLAANHLFIVTPLSHDIPKKLLCPVGL